MPRRRSPGRLLGSCSWPLAAYCSSGESLWGRSCSIDKRSQNRLGIVTAAMTHSSVSTCWSAPSKNLFCHPSPVRQRACNGSSIGKRTVLVFSVFLEILTSSRRTALPFPGFVTSRMCWPVMLPGVLFGPNSGNYYISMEKMLDACYSANSPKRHSARSPT